MIGIPRRSVLRPAGVSILSDPELPREVQAEYRQCVHCQYVWKIEPGSGRMRGFCARCNGPTCGPKCFECKGTWEQVCEDIEAGREPGSRIITSVPFGGNE